MNMHNSSTYAVVPQMMNYGWNGELNAEVCLFVCLSLEKVSFRHYISLLWEREKSFVLGQVGKVELLKAISWFTVKADYDYSKAELTLQNIHFLFFPVKISLNSWRQSYKINLYLKQAKLRISLQLHLHIPFIHGVSALRCIFKEITLVVARKVSSVNMQRHMVNACANGMWLLLL